MFSFITEFERAAKIRKIYMEVQFQLRYFDVSYIRTYNNISVICCFCLSFGSIFTLFNPCVCEDNIFQIFDIGRNFNLSQSVEHTCYEMRKILKVCVLVLKN